MSMIPLVKQFANKGIPVELAVFFLKSYKIENTISLHPFEDTIKANAIGMNDIVINLSPTGRVIAILKERKYRTTMYNRFEIENGKIKCTMLTSSIQRTKKGISKNDRRYKINIDTYFEIYRSKKYNNESPFEPFDSAYGVVDYMNAMFMPGLRKKMDSMVDEIYSNLRNLDRTADYYGNRTWSVSGSKNQRILALISACEIEDIMEKGFTLSSADGLIRKFGKYNTYYKDEELARILKEVPNAKAEWAKIIFESAKDHYNDVKEMLAQPLIKALKGQF